MTHLKAPLSGKRWRDNRDRALAVFREKRHFLFSAYPDADALGTMLALALYLRLMDKKATLFLPSPVKNHLQFMKEIIQYNDITVIEDEAGLASLQNEVDTVIFCDTANARLVSLFSAIQKHFLSREVSTIEIDHHFGNDSAAIAESGIHLFRPANACTEIAAELLQHMHQLHPDLPAPFEQRNIVVSLLMGLLTDTFGGQAVPLPKDYDHWHRLLGEKLAEETLAGPAGTKKNGEQLLFRRPQEIQDHLNQLNAGQKQCVEELKTRIVRHGGIGELNLLDSSLKQLSPGTGKNGNGDFFQLWNTMANVVPQVGGKVGLFYFNGTNAEWRDCIFLKIRRAFGFDRYDLRDAEPALKTAFGEHYLGGGGHAGAVSFRIHPVSDEEFRSRVIGFVDDLKTQIQ